MSRKYNNSLLFNCYVLFLWSLATHSLNIFSEEDKTAIAVDDKTPQTDEVDSASNGLFMSPITLHMTQFKQYDIPIYDFDYKTNRVLFSRIETPAVLPTAEHFGGGAPKGTLVKPNSDIRLKDKKVMKHCETKDINLFSDSNWVIPRVSDRCVKVVVIMCTNNFFSVLR